MITQEFLTLIESGMGPRAAASRTRATASELKRYGFRANPVAAAPDWLPRVCWDLFKRRMPCKAVAVGHDLNRSTVQALVTGVNRAEVTEWAMREGQLYATFEEFNAALQAWGVAVARGSYGL